MNNATYKRKFREQKPETRAKISASLKGRPKSPETKRKISQELKNYWSKIPNNNGLTEDVR